MYDLVLNDVSINYFGEKNSIHSFSYTFKKGINILYGAEKSGKTTILKAIAGLNTIKEGDILLNGASLKDKGIKERDFVMVFDDLALRRRRTARFNLELPLRLRKVDNYKQKTAKICKEFGLTESILDTAVFRLSEEYKARLALARAFTRASKVIMLDNPLDKLAPDIREELFLLLLNTARKTDAVVIIATDSSREVELSNAQTTILDYGYLLESGKASDFAKKPKCLNTATKFVKYGSRFDTLLNTESSIQIFGKNFYFDKDKLLGQNYLGKEVIAVIPYSAVSKGTAIIGKVDNLLLFRGELIAVVNNNEHAINALVDSDVQLGDIISLDIDMSAIYLFDKNNERTIVV